MPLLYLEAAKRHVAAFSGEELSISDHRQAMDCFDCEAFLQLGIDAFDWLTKADLVIRRAVLDGTLEYDEEVDKIIESLFRTWIIPCQRANRWIAKVEALGYVPENLGEFKKCEAQVCAMIRFLDNDTMSEAMSRLRDQAISEHDSGQTAEFV